MFEGWISVTDLIQCYVALVNFAMPIVFVFGMGNIIFDMFTSAAFGGVLKIGGRLK